MQPWQLRLARADFEKIEVELCIHKPNARRKGWSAHALARKTCEKAVRTSNATAKGENAADAAGHATRAAVEGLMKTNPTPAIGGRPTEAGRATRGKR